MVMLYKLIIDRDFFLLGFQNGQILLISSQGDWCWLMVNGGADCRGWVVVFMFAGMVPHGGTCLGLIILCFRWFYLCLLLTGFHVISSGQNLRNS